MNDQIESLTAPDFLCFPCRQAFPPDKGMLQCQGHLAHHSRRALRCCDHLALAAGPIARPRRRRSIRKSIEEAMPITIAGSDASRPKAPPVSNAGPVETTLIQPCATVPDTALPKMPPSAKFQPQWMPIASQRLRVSRKAR